MTKWQVLLPGVLLTAALMALLFREEGSRPLPVPAPDAATAPGAALPPALGGAEPGAEAVDRRLTLVLGVLRGPRAPRDRLPFAIDPEDDPLGLVPQAAREARRRPVRLFVVPALGGRACLLDAVGVGACQDLPGLLGGTLLVAESPDPRRRPDRVRVAGVVPDGVRLAEIDTLDGRTVRARVHANVFVALVEEPDLVRWELRDEVVEAPVPRPDARRNPLGE